MARTRRAGAARTWPFSTSTAASARSACGSRRPSTGPAHGFVSIIAAVARRQGVSGYPGDGTNRWAAVHRDDAARLVTQALTDAPAGALLHVVAEEGVGTRAIAEAVGRTLDLPVASVAIGEVADHFGWLGGFFAMDLAATSTATRKLLDWTPTGRGLIDDIDAGAYR